MENVAEILFRIFLASMVGLAFGWNRVKRHKAAGIRTFSLVSIGSASVILMSVYEPQHSVLVDARVLQGLITSLGFLGAGVIMRDQSFERVNGLTTASMLWTCAIISAVFASGQYLLGAIAFVFVFAYLLIGERLESAIK